MKKRIFNNIVTVMILLALMSLSAAAQTDSAGNVFISDSDPSAQTVERDLYWAGSSRAFNGFQIGKSLIAAGRDITVSDSEVGGSLRTGSYSVTLNGVDVEDNITSAGYNLQLSGVTASGVYLVGNTVYFNGTADHVSIAGGTVTLDGEIVHKGGSMTGGKVKNEVSLITAQCELNRIESDLISYKAENELAIKKYNSLVSQKDSFDAQLTEKRIAIAQLEPIVDTKRAKYEKLLADYEMISPKENEETITDSGLKVVVEYSADTSNAYLFNFASLLL